jgi:aryl-phospho-beta-D-glucosidase BglC (GH1 family)
MSLNHIDRRAFLRNTGLAAAAIGLSSTSSFAFNKPLSMKNVLPRWRGFNLLDYFVPFVNPMSDRNVSTEDDFRWMVDWGFDFVRLPLAYPRYVMFDKTKKITPEEVYKIDEKVVDQICDLVSKANKHGLHVSLNLHRAPGYCINAGFNEPYNLWKDKEAQDAFYFHWGMWAKRFKDISPDKVSFDLLNEPSMREDMNDQHSKSSAVPGDIYRMVVMDAAKAIRAVSPNRLIIADGNNVGNSVIPEIEDLNIAQSCRGYFPHYISHYQAPWVFKDPESAPKPVWPGEINGQYYGREQLEKYYQPWIDLVNKGIGVHCGECGCWIKTPHDVFLSWFGDVLDILTKHNIGYALWNFRGDFGILDSNRADVEYKDWHGHKLDQKMLDLLKKN